jgi:hypothetical protein
MATSSGGAAVGVANALEETSGIGSKTREIVGVDAVVNESSIVFHPGCFFSSLSFFLGHLARCEAFRFFYIYPCAHRERSMIDMKFGRTFLFPPPPSQACSSGNKKRI